MIESHRVDDHELAQVVFVRHVVAVPSHDVERGMVLFRCEQCSLILVDDLES